LIKISDLRRLIVHCARWYEFLGGAKKMFCPNCGKPVPPESKFCPSCGNTVAASTAGAPAAPAAPSFTAAAPAPSAPPAFNPGPVGASDPGADRTFWEKLRAMKTWKKVLIGIALLIVAVVALALFATSGLNKPVERHFAALRAGDIVGAARQQTSLDDFKTMLTNTPALVHVMDESFSSRTVNNGQGELVGTLNLEGGGKLPIEIRLVKENDEWKILAYHVTPIKSME
jgi:ribosomal protein S27AE